MSSLGKLKRRWADNRLKEERNRGEDSVHKREITKCWMTGIPRIHKFEKT